MRCILAFAALFVMTANAAAQSPRIALLPFTSGLSQPVLLTHAADGSGRKFVIEQAGRILVFDQGSTTPTLFLDITSRVLYGGERGLLGLAFHPQFSTDGRFYVNYTRRPDGATVVAEYRGTVQQRVLFTVPQPYENHNGGMLAFAPDGFLYVGMGDGGSGNDPQNRAQNLNELLGKMLRINVDVPDSQPEIFAYGFRNPWRFSFDRVSGQLYVGDVGQGAREEVDIVIQGGNYGWRVWEGTFCTGLGPADCSSPGFIFPVTEYVNTGPNGRCAIIGGYVYRGSQASLPYAAYVFGDLCSGEIFMLNDGEQTLLGSAGMQISSFGEDETGEIYVLGLSGSIFRLTNPDAVPPAQLAYSLSAAGSFVASTDGAATGVAAGYGRVHANNSSTLTRSVSIIGFKQNNVLVSETALVSTSPLQAGRFFAESSANVNTGIALVNPNDIAASVSFLFTDASGGPSSQVVTIPPGRQIISFLNQPPFNGPAVFTGTLTFRSSVSIGIAALRTLTNERGDFVISAVPVFDLMTSPPIPAAVAQFAAGGGWSTEIVLLNPTEARVSGSIQLVLPGGESAGTLPYDIPASGAARLTVPTSAGGIRTGSIRISEPVFVSALMSFSADGVTIAQTTVSATGPDLSFSMYAENSSVARSAIALANLSGGTASVTFEMNGMQTTTSIPPNGQKALFLDELLGLTNLSAPFRGLLHATSDQPIVMTGIRSHINERAEPLISATVGPSDQPLTRADILPLIVQGAGYSTEFVLFGGPASGTVSFFDSSGLPTALQFR